jgi:LCP family protein required for cell wall assembly
MPENRPFDPGNQDQGKQPEQPPSQRRGGGSQYSRFVDEQIRKRVSEPPTRPLVSPSFRKPLPDSRAEVPGPPTPWAPQKRAQRRRVAGWVRLALIVLGVLLLVLGGMGAYLFLTFSGSLSQIVGQQAFCARGTVGTSDPGRLNILLLGSDTDQKFQGQPLAQTDIVVSIDQTARTVGMLSIPRDFFLNVPGYGMHKLDEAYSLGGVALSCLTIEQDFGIPLNYSAWVGLDGFINVINTVGGVDANVTHAIVDDTYPNDINNKADPYALERLYLAPGPQHLNGQQALEYVRSRHADLVGDFGRSARQQQVLLSLKSKLNNPDMFGKLATIANELKGSVKTDMPLTNVLKMMDFAKGVDVKAIQRLVLGPPYSTPGTAPADSGIDADASVVLPNCSEIIPALQKLFGRGFQAVCHIAGNPGVSSREASQQNVAASSVRQPTLLAAEAASSVTGTASLRLEGVVGNATVSLLDGPDDLFGVRSVLDVMLLAVFEAPNVLQV